MLGQPQDFEELLATMARWDGIYFNGITPWHPWFEDFFESADQDLWIKDRLQNEPVQRMRAWFENASPEQLVLIIECCQIHSAQVRENCSNIVGLFVEVWFDKQRELFDLLLLPRLDASDGTISPLECSVVDLADERGYLPAVPYIRRMQERVDDQSRQYLHDRLEGLFRNSVQQGPG